MNPRIIKEIRVVLPAFGLTLAAVLAPPLLALAWAENWMIPLFALGCVFMGALAFGAEFQQGTIDLLLVQPLRRTFIWREKMVVLGVGLALNTAAIGAALLLFRRQVFADDPSAWIGLAFIPLCAFCATPLLTLLSRSFLVGMLASLLLPVVILSVSSLVHPNNPDNERTAAIAVLLVYCGVSCWLGHRRFERMQVVDEYSQQFTREMGVPARVETVLLKPFRAISAGLRGTFGALLKKELRLQLNSFVAAGLFCTVVIIEILVLAWRHNPQEHWAMATFYVTFFGFICIIPAMVGAMSVGEEKTWGVADWQLTLPPPIRKQWAAKMLVTFATSLLLGFLLPWGLIWVLIPLGSRLTGQNFLFGEIIAPPIEIIVLLGLGQLLFTSVAVYAASLAGSTARGILLSFGMLLAAGILIKLGTVVAVHFREPGEEFVQRLLGGRVATRLEMAGAFIAELVLLLCLVRRFAFICYRDRRLTRMQLLIHALVLCLSGILSTAVYHLLAGFRSL